MEPKKYRKKPVTIEAMEVQDDLRQHIEIQRWAASHTPESAVIPVVIPPFDTGLIVHTLEGTMYANLGDYIIKGIAGEFYPCKPDIFAATYEETQ